VNDQQRCSRIESNENSLIVTNVTDTRSEHSAARARPLRWNSLLGLNSFCAKGNFYITILFGPPMSNRRSSAIRIARQREQPNANITSRRLRTKGQSCLICLHASDLCEVQREHMWNLSEVFHMSRRFRTKRILNIVRVRVVYGGHVPRIHPYANAG